MTFHPLARRRARPAALRALAVLAVALGSAGVALAGDAPCRDLAQCECVMRMIEKVRDRGWVGIRMDLDAKGWTVAEVIPGSPAAQAGLRTGDRLRRIQGIPYDREHEAELKQVYESLRPGTELTYSVDRQGKSADVTMTLVGLPPAVLANWVGEMVLEAYAEATGEPVGRYGKEPKKAPNGDDEGG